MPTARGDGDPGPRRSLGRAGNPLVRAVGRVPASVLTKLLVAFAGTVALLVVLGVLGLGVISDSNARVETLGDLQKHATAYRQLQAGVAAVEQVVICGPAILVEPSFPLSSRSSRRAPRVGGPPTR